MQPPDSSLVGPHEPDDDSSHCIVTFTWTEEPTLMAFAALLEDDGFLVEELWPGASIDTLPPYHATVAVSHHDLRGEARGKRLEDIAARVRDGEGLGRASSTFDEGWRSAGRPHGRRLDDADDTDTSELRRLLGPAANDTLAFGLDEPWHP